jgi:hypothetical protein
MSEPEEKRSESRETCGVICSHAEPNEKTRQREPGDDDDVPAPPRFTVPPDQDAALLEHAVKKVLEEMIAAVDEDRAKKLFELRDKWLAEDAK